MGSVLAIRKSAVPSLPENVRKYVEEFFTERKILGVECLYAQRHTYHPSGSSYAKWGNGMAPSHSVDLMRFGKDERGREVNTIIWDAVKSTPDDFLDFAVEEPVNHAYCDD